MGMGIFFITHSFEYLGPPFFFHFILSEIVYEKIELNLSFSKGKYFFY